MCLDINLGIDCEFPIEGKIAKKDIIVYKILTEDFKALYHTNFIYKKDIKQDEVHIIPIKYYTLTYSIFSAYHSYSSLKRIYKIIGCDSDEIVVKCIIPKGATYYQSGMEIASSTIIMKKKLWFATWIARIS